MRNLLSFIPATSLILLLLAYNTGPVIVNKTNHTVNEINLVGSTPGDRPIKVQLGIPDQAKIDFIRWDLKINQPGTFNLRIIFGENQPNTLGFMGGGQTKEFQGIYVIAKNEYSEIYYLSANRLKVSMIRLNDNLFHILDTENNLLVGNGGWSYTLNNKIPDKWDNKLPKFLGGKKNSNDRLVQVIYDGRTPCQEFAHDHQMQVSSACFKLKWKLTLNRDATTFKPTTYSIRKVVDNVPRDIIGSWTIIKGISGDPDAVIYQLDPDKPDQTISLLAVDENILFFLHPNKKLYTGNEDFSFTLNKRL